MTRACAIALVAWLSGCALVHEREGAVVPADATVPRVDVGVARLDAGIAPIDAAPIADAGPITSCEAFWGGLPACPASPALVIGQPCGTEGATCGVHCCEPGPPIACLGGRWQPLDHMDDCSTVHCRGPHPCGAGACAFGRVCVVPAGELGSPAPETCVVPPAPIDSCEAAPPGSLGEDTSSCTACTCAPGASGDPVVTIDCRCC